MANGKGKKGPRRRAQPPSGRKGAAAPSGGLRAKLKALTDPLGLLEGLFVHSPVPYAVFDMKGHCLLTNPAYRAMFGTEPPPNYNVFQDEIAERLGVASLIRQAFQGETLSTPVFWYDPRELRHIHVPEAKRVAISCTFFPLTGTDGAIEYVAIAYKDVTAELTLRDVEEEQRTQRAQKQLRALADTSTALAQATRDFSAALEGLARLTAEVLSECCVLTLLEEETGTLDVVAAYHPQPEARELLRNQLYGSFRNEQGAAFQVVRTGKALLQAHVPQGPLPESVSPGVRQFVERFGLHSSLLVPLRVQHKVIGTLGVSRGQPGHPYTLEDQEFLQELADRAALTIQNVRLLKTAQEAVRLRDEFLSVASHELKTPLTPLSLKLQALERMVDQGGEPGFFEQLRKDVDVMRRQVRRLSALISDLLDVARISGGRLKLQLEEVELPTLVRDVVSRFELEVERVGGRIEVHAGEPFIGHWDRLRLEQVVTNLLSNALKYGQGRPIQVQVETQGRQARLTVRDQGIGVEPQLRARIFEKFERAVSDRHYGGLGLGLYITRQIVEAMGGSIGVESAPHQGATFTVLLPL
jgi:signal transduction histidine kinase